MARKAWDPLDLWNDPRWHSAIQRIIEGYRQRRALNERGQNYWLREDRLEAIQKAARDLARLLESAGAECLEELRLAGSQQVPAEWSRPEATIWRLSQLGAPPPNMGNFPDWDKGPIDWSGVVPLLRYRLLALERMASSALEDPSMKARRGAGAKPINAGEPSPSLWLVNECWTLMTASGRTPSIKEDGPFARLVSFVGERAEEDGKPWALTRMRDEIRRVHPMRKQLDALWKRFDELWNSEGSPHLRGLHPVDHEMLNLGREIEEIAASSDGLVKPSKRIAGLRTLFCVRGRVKQQ